MTGTALAVNHLAEEIGTQTTERGLRHYAAYVKLYAGPETGIAQAVTAPDGTVLAWDGWYLARENVLGEATPTEPAPLDWDAPAGVFSGPTPSGTLHRFNAPHLATGWGYLAYAEHGSVDAAVADLISRRGHIADWQDPNVLRLVSGAVVLAYAPATNPSTAISRIEGPLYSLVLEKLEKSIQAMS